MEKFKWDGSMRKMEKMEKKSRISLSKLLINAFNVNSLAESIMRSVDRI